eukprot:gene2760-4168_t
MLTNEGEAEVLTEENQEETEGSENEEKHVTIQTKFLYTSSLWLFLVSTIYLFVYASQEVEEVFMVVLGFVPCAVFVITALYFQSLFSPYPGIFFKIFSWVPFVSVATLFNLFIHDTNQKNHVEYFNIYLIMLIVFFMFGVLNLFNLRISIEYYDSIKYSIWVYLGVFTMLELISLFSIVDKRKVGLFEMNYFLIIGFGALYGLHSIYIEEYDNTNIQETRYIFIFFTIYLIKVAVIGFIPEIFSTLPEGESVWMIYLAMIGFQCSIFSLFATFWHMLWFDHAYSWVFINIQKFNSFFVSCALWNEWWPLFAIIPFVFSPWPEIVSRVLYTQGYFLKICKETNEEEGSAYEHFFSFITSFLITTGLGIVILLFHCRAIRWEVFIFEIIGCLVLFITHYIFWFALQWTRRYDGFDRSAFN